MLTAIGCLLQMSCCRDSSFLCPGNSDLLVFLGSRKGHSQLISLPASVLNGQPKATEDSQHTAADVTQSAAFTSQATDTSQHVIDDGS